LPDGPLTPARNGLCVAIHLTPRAKVGRVLGVAATADGKRVVRASVAAPPADGRANEAMLQLLARIWQLSRRDLAIVVGAAGRRKTVSVAGDPQDLSDRLGALIATLPDL
jgi:uncharacterized protein (TIGR00251 family)